MPGTVSQLMKQGAVVFSRALDAVPLGQVDAVAQRAVESPVTTIKTDAGLVGHVGNDSLSFRNGVNGLGLWGGKVQAFALIHVEYQIVAKQGDDLLAFRSVIVLGL